MCALKVICLDILAYIWPNTLTDDTRMLIKPLCSPFVRMIARDDDTPMMMKVCQLVAVAETRHASIRAPSPRKKPKKKLGKNSKLSTFQGSQRIKIEMEQERLRGDCPSINIV